MKQSKKSFLLFSAVTLTAFLVLCCLPLYAAEPSQLKAFPPAQEGQIRLVIELPPKGREIANNFKVELIPGKTMHTDGVNLIRLGVNLVPHSLKGWGYTYYELTGDGTAISTMIGVPEGTKGKKTFVHGESIQIRYNSLLPIVIYVPVGYEVRYRIWKAGTLQEIDTM